MSSSTRPGSAAALLLLICVFSLAIHFVSENLGPAAGTALFEIARQAGHSDSHEQGEDHFVLPAPARLSSERFPASLEAPEMIDAASFLASPLLPPPNS
jgi:hypothetical protein